MRVEYVDAVPKKAEVPFVVGGVYRYEGHFPGLRLLVNYEGRYVMVDIENGTVANEWRFEENAKFDLQRSYTYIPDAVLTIPLKEAK